MPIRNQPFLWLSVRLRAHRLRGGKYVVSFGGGAIEICFEPSAALEMDLCSAVVDGMPVVEVRLEHVLVDRVALLGIDLARELVG